MNDDNDWYDALQNCFAENVYTEVYNISEKELSEYYEEKGYDTLGCLEKEIKGSGEKDSERRD